MRTSTTSLRRLSVASVTALALGATLVGCGGSDDTSDSKGGSTPSAAPAFVLDQNQATTALLTVANFGGSFKLDPEVDHSDPAPGCLTSVEALFETTAAAANVVRDFTLDSTTESADVSNRVISFKTTEEAVKAIADLREAMKTCTQISDTIEGAQAELAVETDDDKGGDDADEQVNISATGTITAEGQELEIGQWLSMVRVDNNITLVTLSQLAKQTDADLDEPLAVAIARLEAVAGGKAPDEAATID